MTGFDLSPLYRSTVGFDRLAALMDSIAGADQDETKYPPYNIERIDENSYRITLAVAGFTPDQLHVDVKNNTLTVRGEKGDDKEESTFLHRGIASRNFERRFQLADYVVVKGADLRDGLLHVHLERELPERMKPRRIEIAAPDSGEASSKEIEAEVNA